MVIVVRVGRSIETDQILKDTAIGRVYQRVLDSWSAYRLEYYVLFAMDLNIAMANPLLDFYNPT